MWANPFNVPDEADLIRSPELEIDHWSENLYFYAHDGAVGVSVFAHMSRLSPDPRVWEGNFAVTLPDGKVLVNRSIGYSPNLAWTGQLGLDCVVPNRRWRWHFFGVMQETNSQQQATTSRLPDARIPAWLDLTFDAVHPVWSKTDMAAQEWASFHTEQGGRLKGSFTWGNQTVQLNCTGWRDHSAGPRSYKTLTGNIMPVCIFPSGKTVIGTLIWSGQNNPVSFGYVVDGEHFQNLTLVSVPPLTALDGSPREMSFELEVAGKRSWLKGEALNSIVHTLGRPQGMTFGYDPVDPQTCVLCSCPTRFEWEGEIGYGWTDRLYRVEHFVGAVPFPTM